MVLSEFTRQELAKLDAPTAIGARLLPGGVDLDHFSPGLPVSGPWVANATPLLFCARRLTPRTGVQELVQAMPAIRSAFPGVRLAIAGAGRAEATLRSESAALGVEDCVRFLGRISEDALPRWYRAADLVILPTQELEGFGLATAESLACGTPVLGTPVGATPEILAPLAATLLTRDRSPSAIADGAIALLRDPPQLARIGAAARARVTSLGWDTVVGGYLELYESLALRRG